MFAASCPELILWVCFLSGPQQTETSSTVVAVSVVAGIVGIICLTLVGFIVHHMYKPSLSFSETILNKTFQ